MKVLVLNSGSSSVKFQLFDMSAGESLASGLIEQIGEDEGHAKLKYGHKKVIERNQPIPSHKVGLGIVAEMLAQSRLLASFKDLDGIGHRVVHGGEKFQQASLINDEVMRAIEDVSPLAPLHNPANLDGIKVAKEEAPDVPQVAVFDTAFHQTIPPYAYMYAIPNEYYQDYGVRRYGFHGTSHYFVAKEAARYMGKPLEELNLITLHLGNGASVAAIHRGKSVDTSMGMTPLEGLVMGTRSGDVDPGVIFYLARQTGKNIDEMDKLLNKQSGLKGLCGHNDVREIIAHAKSGDEWSKLALMIFSYRIKKYIGAYAAVLGRVDALIFTGGIGEHAPMLREMICEGLDESLGLIVDVVRDSWDMGSIWEVSEVGSKIKMLVVPTNEELEIASQTVALIKNQ